MSKNSFGLVRVGRYGGGSSVEFIAMTVSLRATQRIYWNTTGRAHFFFLPVVYDDVQQQRAYESNCCQLQSPRRGVAAAKHFPPLHVGCCGCVSASRGYEYSVHPITRNANQLHLPYVHCLMMEYSAANKWNVSHIITIIPRSSPRTMCAWGYRIWRNKSHAHSAVHYGTRSPASSYNSRQLARLIPL